MAEEKHADERHDPDHRQAETSQAARTPDALHEDALSPGRAVREYSGADGAEGGGASQRIGNTGAQGPTVSFPGEHGQATKDGAEPSPDRAPQSGTDANRDER